MRFAIPSLLASSLRTQPSLARTSLIEALEDRQFLSITPATSVAPAADLVHIGDVGAFLSQSPQAQPALLADSYSGRLKFHKVPGQPRPMQDLIVNFTSETTSGAITGTITAASLGTVNFTGQVIGKKFDLTFSGAVTGSAVGKIRNHGTRISGKLLNITAGTAAKFSAKALGPVNRVLTTATSSSSANVVTRAIVSGGSVVTPAAALPSDVQLLPGSFRDASGELHFTGTYSGNASLRQVPDGQFANRNSFPFQSYPITLTISSETEDDLLTGTMNGGALGNYNVTGVVKLSTMTLIITPAAAGTGGTGVLRLTVNKNGTVVSGSFQQEANSVMGFGSVTLNHVSGDGVLITNNGATVNVGNTSGSTSGSTSGTTTGTTTTGTTTTGTTTTGTTTTTTNGSTTTVTPATTINTGVGGTTGAIVDVGAHETVDTGTTTGTTTPGTPVDTTTPPVIIVQNNNFAG